MHHVVHERLSWKVGGELEDAAEAQANLKKWMLPCFGGIVFLLVWQFNSIRRAAIIILTMPLIIVGAVTAIGINNHAWIYAPDYQS